MQLMLLLLGLFVGLVRGSLPLLPPHVQYVPLLDGLEVLDHATICASTLYRCDGCPAGTSAPLAISPKNNQPFAQLNDAYADQKIGIIRPFSIVSTRRLRGSFHLLRYAMLTVPGDVVETGVFTGGSGILMATTLKDWDMCGRRYWGYDSFKGLPEPVAEDKLGSRNVGNGGLFTAGKDLVYSNFNKAGINDSTLVTLVEGWFNDTLPYAEVKHIAFLRLDGDLFSSTMDGLLNLYDKLVPGGIVYVDDYGSFNGCKIAVDMFRSARGIAAPLHWILEDNGIVEAVWWRRPSLEHHHG